jgi:hypothetical protein
MEDKGTITKEIQWKEEIIAALRERQHVLQVQAARQGDSTPAHVITEIARYDELIRSNRAEIDQLQQQATEGARPLEEDEYLALLAEAWNTTYGDLTILSVTRLEWTRRRLKLSVARAADLEQEIRVALAYESLAHAKLNLITDTITLRAGHEQRNEICFALGRAIQLNLAVALKAAVDEIAEVGLPLYEDEVDHLYLQLRTAHNALSLASPYAIQHIFGEFVTQLKAKLEADGLLDFGEAHRPWLK